MNRLYNEHSACPHEGVAATISKHIDDAFLKVWDEISKHDVCPRDAELYCHNTLSQAFAEHILQRAVKGVDVDKNFAKAEVFRYSLSRVYGA